MKHFRAFFILLAIAAMVTLTVGSLPAAEKIDINTASAKELTQLDRIGPALAERVVEYREKNGPFEKPEDITKVKGIGAKTFEGFRDRIIASKSGKKADSGKTAEKKSSGADKASETESNEKNKAGKKSSEE